PDAIAEYLVLGYVPAPLTGFADIHKVPPGHLVIFEHGHVTSRPYWQLKYVPKNRIGFQEAAAVLREQLDEAVRLRLISDVPLGAFLSGGLDSSTVVALMAAHAELPVKTFSIGFKDEAHDELRYARLVARRFG